MTRYINIPTDTDITLLKLITDCMGIPVDKSINVEYTNVLHKSIYLCQGLAGVDLGYYFEWYSSGPYCPQLSVDIDGIWDEEHYANNSDHVWRGKHLKEHIRSKIETILPILEVPEEYKQTLNKSQWLQVIGCLHFLKYESKLNEESSLEVMSLRLPEISKFCTPALEVLKDNGYMN